MQRVVRHMVDGHVVPHIAPGPLNQRVELGAALVVLLARGHVTAVVGLFAAQTSDPGAALSQHASQRLQLADAAAGLAQVNAFVHGLVAVLLHERDRRLVHRLVDLDVQAGIGVVRLDGADQRRRFRMQHARLQRTDGNGQLVTGDQVGDDHVLHTQAGRLHHLARVLDGRSLEQLDGGVHLGGIVSAGVVVERDGRTCRCRPTDQRRGFAHVALLSQLERANAGLVTCTSPW